LTLDTTLEGGEKPLNCQDYPVMGSDLDPGSLQYTAGELTTCL